MLMARSSAIEVFNDFWGPPMTSGMPDTKRRDTSHSGGLVSRAKPWLLIGAYSQLGGGGGAFRPRAAPLRAAAPPHPSLIGRAISRGSATANWRRVMGCLLVLGVDQQQPGPRLPGEVLFVLGRQAAPPHAQRDPLDHGRLAIEDLDPSSPAVDHLEIGLAVVVAPTVLARQAARPVPAARAGTGIVGARTGAVTLDFVFLME